MNLDNVDDIYPLSPMQQLMLMHSLRLPGASTLTNQFRFEINGDFNADSYAAAWQHGIDHHPALRTAFVWQDIDHPVQVVHSKVDMPVNIIDLQEFSEADQTSRLAGIIFLEKFLG